MNSTAAQDFLRAHRRGNIHLYLDDWKKLPVPDISLDAQRPVVDPVESVLTAKQANPDADMTSAERKLDGIVQALYGFEE